MYNPTKTFLPLLHNAVFSDQFLIFKNVLTWEVDSQQRVYCSLVKEKLSLPMPILG